MFALQTIQKHNNHLAVHPKQAFPFPAFPGCPAESSNSAAGPGGPGGTFAPHPLAMDGKGDLGKNGPSRHETNQPQLVGGWALPLWKIGKSIGMMTFPRYGKIQVMFQSPPTKHNYKRNKTQTISEFQSSSPSSNGRKPTLEIPLLSAGLKHAKTIGFLKDLPEIHPPTSASTAECPQGPARDPSTIFSWRKAGPASVLTTGANLTTEPWIHC